MSDRIRVGTAGWSYGDWKGPVYPAPRPRGFDELAYLARLVEWFGALPLAIEVRHASFAAPDAEAYLAALGAGVADIDMPAGRDNLPLRGRAIGNLGYVRLHGRNAAAWFDRKAGRDERYDWLYSPGEVDTLADAVRATAAATGDVFVIANNHFRGKAPANAFMLKARLLGRPVPVPPDLLRAYPLLEPDAADLPPPPGAQGRLFG